MSEKTEQPTEKKIQDGKKEGQVVKSMEIISGLQLLAIFLFFHFFSAEIVQQSSEMLLLPLKLINSPFEYSLTVVVAFLIKQSVWLMGLFFGLLAVTTILGVIIQIGVMLASKAVGFKGERINPVSNVKQIFSLHSLMELGKSTLKVILLSLIFGYLFYFYSSTLRELPSCNLVCSLTVFMTFLKWMWGTLMLFYIVLGVADYSFQHYNVMKQLKMTKEEVKREYKDSEGDPEIKRRRHELQREIQSGSLAQNVRQSAVVVRNPAHIAVCLGYHPETMPVPRVLEKGKEARAKHIIALAEREAIPVVENIALARRLFREVDCGKTIPEYLFEPVAALLRFVLEIDYSEGGEDEMDEDEEPDITLPPSQDDDDILPP